MGLPLAPVRVLSILQRRAPLALRCIKRGGRTRAQARGGSSASARTRCAIWAIWPKARAKAARASSSLPVS
ncbi:hypothetical protein [Cupriavidus sp. WS]|uniref:hypothetical protein n=1 Tax=Cupriavidus sp. WS TaxID=1312922 RepID=UPI0012DE4575|nr:hypothetical protein [Cupriavidus sp. WS]